MFLPKTNQHPSLAGLSDQDLVVTDDLKRYSCKWLHSQKLLLLYRASPDEQRDGEVDTRLVYCLVVIVHLESSRRSPSQGNHSSSPHLFFKRLLVTQETFL